MQIYYIFALQGNYFLDILCVQEVVTPIYVMSYYIKWDTTSLTYGTSWIYSMLKTVLPIVKITTHT